MPIEHVSDTARWVAVYRAMETDRADALFKDPFARRLAGERGQAIVDEMKRGRSMAWSMITRTVMFDDIILDLVARQRVGLVVNLACGLDTRPWRLKLPPHLRWVDVDFSVMIDYKTDVMRGERPVCRYEAVATDLTDVAARRALFARLGAEAERTLVIAEGLLIYLTAEQVGALAQDLYGQPTFRWWLIDLAHPELLKLMTKTWGVGVASGRAPFLFTPDEGTRFFSRFGWREVLFKSTMEEARRIRREMRGMWFWRLLGMFASRKRREVFRLFSGAVLLERQ